MARHVWVPLVLLLCAAVALGLRVLPGRDHVLRDDGVCFQGTDAWFHVRLIDNTVHNFPHRIRYDPFAVAPQGQAVPVAPLFDQLVAAAALVVGRGSPTERQVHVVAAWTPSVIGALLVIVVYGIGNVTWDRNVGLVAAGLTAVLPGVHLRRTLFGNADHHGAESLFAALALLGLLLALGRAEGSRRIGWSLLFGLALLAYLFTWVGGALLVLVLLAWLVPQFVSDRLRGRSPRALALAVIPGLALAWVGLLPASRAFPYARFHVVAVTVACGLAAALWGLATVARRRGWRGRHFVAAVVGSVAAAVALFAFVAPGSFAAGLAMLRTFLRPAAGVGVEEVRPLLDASSGGALSALWDQFTTAAPLAAIGFVTTARIVLRTGCARQSLILVWSLAFVMATFVQVRFGYYAAPAVALLAAVVCRDAYRWAMAPVPAGEEPARGRSGKRWINATLAGVGVFLFACYPNLVRARRIAAEPMGPDTEWLDTLDWLRAETPAPFDDTDYDRRWAPVVPGATYPYPDDTWSVMNWWDYGYWILTRARRFPVSIPTQTGAGRAAAFYLAQGEAEGTAVLEEVNARYVVVDHTLPFFTPTATGGVSGKFRSIARWAGHDPDDYLATYHFRGDDGTLTPRTLFHPEYYRSMLVRLYLYEGRAVPAPSAVVVVAWKHATDPAGERIKEVTGSWRFATAVEARAWIAARPGGNHRVVSDDPLASPVALEPLRRFRLVHGSPTAIAHRGARPIAYVEVFRYDARAPG